MYDCGLGIEKCVRFFGELNVPCPSASTLRAREQEIAHSLASEVEQSTTAALAAEIKASTSRYINSSHFLILFENIIYPL